LKTGGVFVCALRKKFTLPGNENGFHEKLQELTQSGKFELLKDWTFYRGVEGAEYGEHGYMESYMIACRRLN